MKKTILFLIFCAIFSFSQAQPLTGIKTVGAGGDYPTLAAAITDLNTNGVGAGGVTFNITSGHTETFSSPTAGLITATGTASNPIIFQKSGAGANPLITAGTGTSTTTDGIIKIAGGDYITFDGVDLAENVVNINPTQQMEWGYALVKKQNTAPFDGCQNVTIKNCTITLNKTNTASVGIYSGNHIATSTTSLSITVTTDAMNNCKFFNNSIANVYSGIQLKGYAASAPYTLYDSNNEIGVDGANAITNYGGGASTSYGIYSIYQTVLKVANNLISGGTGTSTLYGIFISTGTSVDIYSNTVTITGGGTSSSLYGIRNNSGVSTFTCNIYGNNVTNCSYPTSTGGIFTGISNEGTPGTLNLYSNSVNNNTLPGDGNFTGISGGSPANLNMYDNTVYNNSKTGPGTLYCMRAGSSAISFHDNVIHSNTISTTGTVTAPGIIYGYYNSSNFTTESIVNNQIYGLTVSGSTTSSISTICGLYSNCTNGSSKMEWLNMIWNLSVTTAGSGTIYGMYSALGSTINIEQNNISNLSASGPSGFVIGIYLPSGTTANIYNNMVGDLHKPAANGSISLAGIRIDGGTTVNAYYNTVYLNSTSTGALFGSAALYASTTPTVTLRNNILVNTSTPSGSGITAAYRRSTISLTSYGSTSNNNCFYAGSPSATNVIFYDGASSYQTLANFQALVAPRDDVSVTEMPPFQSTISPMNLHISTTTPTWLESGGSLITGFDNDYDNDIRQGSPGYTGTGTAPDIGADEFEGQSAACPPPGNLIATNITSTSADLSWTPGGSETSWNIEWGPEGFTQGTGTLITGVTANPYTITGLTLCESYDFYVQANCGSAGNSGWAGPATFMTSLSGNYTINSAEPTGGTNFNSFTDLANAYNLCGLSGPTTVNVIGGNQKEVHTGPMHLTSPPTAEQLLILGNGNTLEYLSTDPNEPATLWLDGVDNVTIENLTVKALGEDSDGFGWAVWLSNGADNNTFNNCQFITTMDSQDPDFIPFVTTNFPTNPVIFDQAASNLTVSNCIAKGGYYGMIIKGSNNEITNNQMKDFYSYGLWVGGFGNSLISGNILSRPERTEVATSMMYLKGNFSGTSITKNRLIKFAPNANTTSTSYGIYAEQVYNYTEFLIANNVISGFQNMDGIQYGIYMNGTILGLPVNIKIYHNSVSLDNEDHPGASNIYGLYFAGHYNTLDIRNNIISYTTNSTGAKYCLYFNFHPASNPIVTCDYNVLHRGAKVGTANRTGFWSNFPYETLPDWKTAYGGMFDQNSLRVKPMFFDPSSGNLQPQNPIINDKGTNLILVVPDDINYVSRPQGVAPDPGAYEFSTIDPCEYFDDGLHNFITYSDDGGTITNTTTNLVVVQPGSQGYTGDLGLEVTDISGGTFVYNSSGDYSGNYNTSSKKCLCWDMNVLQNNGQSYFPSLLIYGGFDPSIPRSATNPQYLAEFTSNSLTGLNEWVRTCAPINKAPWAPIGPPPVSSRGTWTWINNNPSINWEAFIQDIDGIMFRVDILGGGGQEIFRLDSICMGCRRLKMNFLVWLGGVHYQTQAEYVTPLIQPFNTEPWNYDGTEAVPSIPPNVVDWVLIELRDAPDAASAVSATAIGRRAAFLMSDSTVRDIEGDSLLEFDASSVENNLFLIVRHRNHIDIMSSSGLTLMDGIYTYDFTDAMSKVYGGSLGYMQISTSPPRFGMVPGDGNADGTVDINDLYPIWHYDAGKQGYLPPDYNLDNQVDNRDKNDMWLPSLGKSSQVPQ